MSILLVDSYDSFTFNLKNLIETLIPVKVFIIHNDTFSSDDKELAQFVNQFDAIIIGPGPGDPRSPVDVGIIPYLLTLKTVPILGVCLGFQCLCKQYGEEILFLPEVKHGQVYKIKTAVQDLLFKDSPTEFDSVRYHSIYVKTPLKSDNLIPLAITMENDEEILMAAKHTKYPHYGVQYHPESICSQGGEQLIQNFWKLATKFNSHRQITLIQDLDHDEHILKPTPLFSNLSSDTREINYQEISLQISTIDICNHLQSIETDFMLLNSAALPGRWTIIGIPIPSVSDVITHSTQSPTLVNISKWKQDSSNDSIQLDSDIWSFVAHYVEEKSFQTTGKADEFPFVGGLIGFFSYEEGEFVDIDNLNDITRSNVPDTKLCFIERFILHDLELNVYYVVSVREHDDQWIVDMKLELQKVTASQPIKGSVKDLVKDGTDIEIEMPQKDHYVDQFKQCQEYLHKGDSYELCLTTTTKLKISRQVSSWDIYRVLTTKNPSPYSCYMRFEDCELLSSSPERFLSWDDKSCQLRPIKGTVKKSPSMSFEKLKSILKTPKEMGENLMIVDLIRHDLYNFLSKVHVSQLMTVEEYKTVYQLVSVIDGTFDTSSQYRGLDILSKSLPPGSMTGAPKKRSVEILQKLEGHDRRGIYSGVCGYYSLNNKSDWSVIIRSCFKYNDDLKSSEAANVWRIGAGGAITVLSSCEEEWEEMEIKLNSALQAFK